MSLGEDLFGKLRLEKRFQAGGATFLVPGLAIAALTARFGDQGWVKILFYSLAAILGMGSMFAFRGSFIIVPGVKGQGDLAIYVSDNHDQAESFVFSVNLGR